MKTTYDILLKPRFQPPSVNGYPSWIMETIKTIRSSRGLSTKTSHEEILLYFVGTRFRGYPWHRNLFGKFSKFRRITLWTYQVCYYISRTCKSFINYLDAYKRTIRPSFPHIDMTIERFCQGVDDETRVQCILDCPTLDGEKPSLIKYVFYFITWMPSSH